jgi:hypothetical protein
MDYVPVCLEQLRSPSSTPEFLSATRKLLNEEERIVLVDYLARNPTAGDLTQGTGGVRKLRWGLAGRGKRGGARVIYFYHNGDLPLFLLTAFAKNVQVDITQAARNDFHRLTRLLVENYGRRKK